MRVRRLAHAELVTTRGLPSVVRVVACTVLAGAVATVGFTLGFWSSRRARARR